MKLREWVNNNSALATIIAVLVLIGALVYMVASNTRSKPKVPTHRWYFDVSSGELFSDTFDKIAPFDAPSGGEAVQAIVYGCGDCDDLKIAWLMKYTQEMKEQMMMFRQQMKERTSGQGGPGGGGRALGPLGMMPPDMMRGPMGQLFSMESPIEWVDSTSPDAMSFMQGAYDCPDGVKVKSGCFPSK